MQNVLIFNRCKFGYIHDNIETSTNMLLQLLTDYNVIVSDDPDLFNEDVNFDLIIFPNTNNDVFNNDNQRETFKKWIQRGGKVLGIHSFIGTERNWEWFKKLKGCSFLWHPELQMTRNTFSKLDNSELKNDLMIEDECYFGEDYFDGVEVITYHDLNYLDKSELKEIVEYAGKWFPIYPSTWYQNYDGGHVWVTSLGHKIETYSNDLFINHIKSGIELLNGK